MKPAVRQLIALRGILDQLEADIRENMRLTEIASRAAIVELGTQIGDERLAKTPAGTWTLRHEPTGIRVIRRVLDEDI